MKASSLFASLRLLFVGPVSVASAIAVRRAQSRIESPKLTSNIMTVHAKASVEEATPKEFITVIGLGSLLSERSSRTTFPNLENFRLGRVPGFRRVFGHPASIFFQRGIASLERLEMSSLSAEPEEQDGTGFVCTLFDVPNDNKSLMHDNGAPSQAYLEREEEFDIRMVPYLELDGTPSGQGILCCRATDDLYIKRWGQERFDQNFVAYGIDTIWNWHYDSGLKPCSIYLRHCVVAAQNMGDDCYNSFLDETFLVDRKTTLRTYLHDNPHIMTQEPPPELAVRYGG